MPPVSVIQSKSTTMDPSYDTILSQVGKTTCDDVGYTSSGIALSNVVQSLKFFAPRGQCGSAFWSVSVSLFIL